MDCFRIASMTVLKNVKVTTAVKSKVLACLIVSIGIFFVAFLTIRICASFYLAKQRDEALAEIVDGIPSEVILSAIEKCSNPVSEDVINAIKFGAEPEPGSVHLLNGQVIYIEQNSASGGLKIEKIEYK